MHFLRFSRATFVVGALTLASSLSGCCLQGICYASGCCSLGTDPIAQMRPATPLSAPGWPVRLAVRGQPQAF